ncbi:MFS transporter [Stella sp.]|uniref:MFS transporter n=1 Tax=Stella sp. TaxID=2912054 RepID=UPI0035B460D3
MKAAEAGRIAMVVIVAGCLFNIFSFGLRTGYGLFLEPMSATYGWGREVFSFASAIQNLLWGLGVPFAAAAADRWGTARVLALGALLYGGGTALMPFATEPWMLTATMGVMVGLGLSCASFSIVLAALGRAVPAEQRTWAFGLGTAAGSLGQFLIAPVEQLLLGLLGWSSALVAVGAMALVMLPLAWLLRGRPAQVAGQQSLGEALREAGSHLSYWYLVAGFFVCGFHVAFILTHLPPYLKDVGVPASVAGWSLALVGLFNIVGSYTAGVLGGRRSKKWLLSLIYLGRAVVITAFVLTPPSTASVLVFAAAMGLLWLSTVPLTSGLVALMFGPRYMATLFGIVFFSHQVGAFIGVWLGGRIYDATGSYDLVWWFGVALGVFAALVHLPIAERSARLAPALR